MIVFGHVALLRPWWLLALPAALLLYAATRPRGGALAGWDKAADSHLLAAMAARGVRAAATSRRRAPALLVALLLGTLALAGPAVRRQAHDRLRNLDATIVVMDVSQDMGGQIREAASAAHDVLAHLGARQAALVVFAGDAYLASALTDSTAAIDTDLFSLDDTTVPDPGVRPDKALVLAGRVLDEAHILNGDVVLFSSGGGLSGTGAIRAASALARSGHRVFTVDCAAQGRGTGSARAALDAVAAAGDGFAVPVLRPDRLLATLGGEAIRRTDSSIVNTLDWRDLGRLVLLLAALPLLLGFRKAAVA